MKKLLLALVLMVPMLAFTGCGGGDDGQNEPDTPTSMGIDINWIKSNINGEWFCYKYYNKLSGVWITNDLFPDYNYTFSSDGNVTISGNPFKTGTFPYSVYKEGAFIYIQIGDDKNAVISMDKDIKEISTFDFKIRKR